MLISHSMVALLRSVEERASRGPVIVQTTVVLPWEIRDEPSAEGWVLMLAENFRRSFQRRPSRRRRAVG